MLIKVKSKVCEVLQLETKVNSLDYKLGSKLFKLYEKRIAQAPKSVREVFTVDNIMLAFANLRYLNNIVDNYSDRARRLKLPLYSNFKNPCFLLIVYSGIENSKVGNVTLHTLVSLGLVFSQKRYFPKPNKRIFIANTNGKMRPLGIASSCDKIVQLALMLILLPRFNRIFSDFSYGFRSGRSCHSALKCMYSH